MKTRATTAIQISETTSKTRSGAAVKSALVWGTVYSTATTGAVYAMASGVDTEPLTLSHVLTESMVMFYPFGAARGLLIWHLKTRRRRTLRNMKTVRWLNKRLPRNSRSRAM